MWLHIFLEIVVIAVIVMCIVMFFVTSASKREGLNRLNEEVRSFSGTVLNKISSTGSLSMVMTDSFFTELEQAAQIYNGRVIIVDGALNIISDTYRLEIGKTLISEEVIRCLRGTSNYYQNEVAKYAEIMQPIIDQETSNSIGVFIIRFSLEGVYDQYKEILQQSWILLAFLFVTTIIIALVFSYRLTRPLKKITATLDHVSQGYLEDKVSIKGYYEIEKISDSFNEMLGQINKLEESRQEFVSNVSHELKTPMTSIKVLADSLLAEESVPEALYREFLVDINEEIERENKIISDLLSLVKLDKKTGEMHIAQVSINELLEINLRRLKPIAQKANIELIYESFRTVLAEVDEVKLSLALSNLVENAIKYNTEGGWVKVSLNSDHKYFFIRVADSGIGIPEEEQDRIFDRFYRVDKTRARITGGTGLGLAITKNVILMHKGTIKLYSKENEGSMFTIRIPLNFSIGREEDA